MKEQRKKSSSSESMVLEGRIPPQAVDAEEYVLGALMLESQAFEQVIHILGKEMFYKPAHGLIYGTIEHLYNRKEPIDILTVTRYLRETGKIEEVGGSFYVTQLTLNVMSAAHVEYHAAVVFQKFVERKIIRLCMEKIEAAYSGEHDVADLYTGLERDVSEIGEMIAGKKKSRELREIVEDCIVEAKQRRENFKNGKENGVKTGFCDLDKITNGWQNSDLIILAARPSMGKTAVALKMVREAAKAGTHVVLFSLEMKDTQLVHRMLLSGINVNPDSYASGATNDEDMQRLDECAEKIKDLPIIIDHSPGVTMSYIRAQSKIHKKQGKCGLIVIDYLQLVKELENVNRNREQAMAAISNQCKSLAKELDVPVIALSQLNRECIRRKTDGYKPALADLRDSGAIEQDADMVIFVHRPEKYKKQYQEEAEEVEFVDKKGKVVSNYGQLIVEKNRNGKCGEVEFTHNGNMTEFFDYDTFGYACSSDAVRSRNYYEQTPY